MSGGHRAVSVGPGRLPTIMDSGPHRRERLTMGHGKELAGSPSSAGPTIFLHIGTPKSGTTYLQSRMVANHKLAKRQGLLWPGPAWRAHVMAVEDLRQLSRGGQLDPDGPWLRLARKAHAWSGSRVLISMEWLGGCTPHQIAAAVDGLQPSRVEVICTARDLGRNFATQWQEMTKNARPWTWSQFVEEMIEDKPGPARRAFWRQQDIPGILRKWGRFVPSDRIHLITVPSRECDSELLWQRFCSVVDLDGSSFQSPRHSNESLGAVSAVLMQRINVAAIDRKVPYADYKRVFQSRLADRLLGDRRGAEQPIAVSGEVDTWISTRAERLVQDLHRLDVDVVGDLDELLPGDAVGGREPDQVTDEELLDACLDALVSLGVSQLQSLQRAEATNRTLQHEIVSLRQQQAPPRRRSVARRLGARARRLLGHGKAGMNRFAHRHRDDDAQ